jgi:hypothetical protein
MTLAYRPRGVEMRYLVVREADDAFSSWRVGASRWRPGRATRSCANPDDPADTYRIPAAAFACTYEILRPAP